jgi:L-fucose mutarotase
LLKGLSPLLVPDLLQVLCAMGHGDEIAIVDANFPAASVGRRVIEVAGATTTEVLEAVLDVMPLDTFVSPAAVTMEVVGDARARPAPVLEFEDAIARRSQDTRALGHHERKMFYDRARQACAIVRTGDTRPYANILLVKGVI